MNFYNDNDPKICAWLRELIKAKLIPDGIVDSRSIELIQPDELKPYIQCHFFAGIGGWPEALRLAGWPVDAPVWTGSCPCQPFSSAGKKAVQSDERHVWKDWVNLISKCRPGTIFGEQVNAAIAAGWVDDAFVSLEENGYACAAAVLPACSVGAKHRRHRLFFIADAEWHQQPWQEPCNGKTGRVGRKNKSASWNRDWESALREFRALDDGLSYGVEAVNGPRNAIVPQVAAEFIGAYMDINPLPL